MADTTIKNQIYTRKQASSDSLKTKRQLWDSAEELFHGQLNDALSLEGPNRVFDPKLSTLVMERAYRVMAQLPTGKVRPISKNDRGASELMNLILDKYVLPQANAQFDFLTKMRMVDLYSNIYGNFFTLTDWDVKPNGYIGPDVWLLNIRDVFPQVGAVSLEDSDHVIVRTWKPLSYFEGLAKAKGFKNIPAIIAKLKETAGSKQNRPTTDTSQREMDQYPGAQSTKNSGYFEVLTQFERDRWIDYVVDADMEFRDIKSPQEGELPIDCKYSIPLLDDFMGMGDMERGGSMQQVINSNWNLYGKAWKMSIFPPVMFNKDAIAEESSLRYIPAAKWMMRAGMGGSVQGAASPINVAPQGLQTFNNTQQMANASLLNMFGTSDTAVTQQTDPGFGKTPRALAMQAQRENTRDLADRFYMEQYMKKVIKKMVNLISNKQSSSITIRLFDQEIQTLSRSYPEIKDMYDEKTGKITIKKSQTGSIIYDYEIVSGSTFAADQKSQQENLGTLADMYMKSQTPQGNTLEADLKKDGYNFHFGELFKQFISSSGIQGWDKILEEMSDEEKNKLLGDQTMAKFQNVAQQMLQGQGQNMNAIPPMPQGQPPQPNSSMPAMPPMPGGTQ